MTAAPDLAELADRLGLEHYARSWGPCPACKAERRGREDRRGPVAIRGESWRCWTCGAGGGAGALLAAVRLGEVPPKGDPRWGVVLRELDGEGLQEGPQVRRERPPPPPPEYPPLEEVRALWGACVALTRPGVLSEVERQAAAWFRVRGLDAARLAALDMVRLAPAELAAPVWFPGSPWVLACPLVDHIGLTRSLRWRAIRAAKSPAGLDLDGLRAKVEEGDPVALAALADPALVAAMSPLPGGAPKSRGPAGYSTRGLLLADPMARAVFAGRPEVEIPALGVRWRWSGKLVMVEGEPALWRLATLDRRFGADGSTYAAVGYSSGSWTAEHAARLPAGSEVRIIPDSDEAGQKLAEAVQRTMPPGVRVEVAPIRR